MRSLWWRCLFLLWALSFSGDAVARAQGTASSGARPRTRVVSTADEFLAAFREGVLHIVVGAHIDLTGKEGRLDIEFKGYDFDKPLIKLNGTESVRVRPTPNPSTGHGYPPPAARSCRGHRHAELTQPCSGGGPSGAAAARACPGAGALPWMMHAP